MAVRFTGPAVIHEPFFVSRAVIAGGCAVADGVACLRRHHTKHWCSGGVAGAGSGIASTLFPCCLCLVLKNRISGSGKLKGDVLLVPLAGLGFLLVKQF